MTILIDYSQCVLANLYQNLGMNKTVQVDLPMLRHMVLNAIRSYKTKYGAKYGEMIICVDSRKSWRKEVFPQYKANRKKARDASAINFDDVFAAMNTIRDELDEFFPYTVLQVDHAEADDLIAVMVAKLAGMPVPGTLFDEPRKILIMSSDHDFKQLHKYEGVHQWSPAQKLVVKLEGQTPEEYLRQHILEGDKGDGVPNVLTDDLVFVEGRRQKPLSKEKLALWVSNPGAMPKTDEFIRNYQRNAKMVNLDLIPDHIQGHILAQYEAKSARKKDRSMLLQFMMDRKLKHLIDYIGDF